MKFGIVVANDTHHTRQLDKENDNEFWENKIQKEVSSVILSFQLLEHNEPTPVGCKRITYYFIFDIKFDLTRKAQCVAGQH